MFYSSPNPIDSFLLFCSVQFSRSVVSDSLQHHESQHIRPPCPSPTPGVHPNPCPSSRWCHPAISSSVVPFSCPQSFPASGSFPLSQLFAWGGQRIGVSSSRVAISSSRGIFPTQGLNPGFPDCRWILCHLSHQGSLRILEWGAYLFSSGSSQLRNWTRVSCFAGRLFTNRAIKEVLE